MPGFYLHTSNRLEVLIKALSRILSDSPESPLEKEMVVVQSPGMERWISMELARAFGICANVEFPFPNHLISRVFSAQTSPPPDTSHYERRVMTWRIMKLLPRVISGTGFEELARYLDGPSRDLKLIQLASRIADTFDNYTLFRPGWILDWEKGREDHWQARLWNTLNDETPGTHRAGLYHNFLRLDLSSLEQIRQNAALPRRIAVFGISALPPFHMDILYTLARVMDIHIFHLNPCHEYWMDIVPDRLAGKIADRYRKTRISAEALHLERGNSLLASMGKMGAEFLEMCYAREPEDRDRFDDPGEDTLLHTLQSDILNLRDRERPEAGKKTISPGDTSVQVHVCHSPMREMEVLRDRLLDLLGSGTDLEPRHILVITPDIEKYTPYIQAVFDIPRDDPLYIPFTISDRTLQFQGWIIPWFSSLLDLAESRFTASQVMEMLECPVVRRAFDLDDRDVEQAHQWVRETRIRWGIDEIHRETLDLPAFRSHTWLAGLDRLLLGYAMPGEEKRCFEGVLPYDPVEGSDSLLLEKLLRFTGQLFTFRDRMNRSHTPEAWSRLFSDMLEAFFQPDEDTQNEIQTLRETFLSLTETASRAGYRETVPLTVIRSVLQKYFEEQKPSMGFLSGGITFGAMLPMRSIPFRVICLVGMNGENYPRQSPAVGFDLITRNPRQGDRSKRNDDRYLFLETILSARENLVISYVGRDVRDNTSIPPSVLISELLDAVDQGFRLPDGGSVRERITQIHRLQAFHPAYFSKDTGLFSYSPGNLSASKSLLSPGNLPEPFFSEKIPSPDETGKEVSLDALCAFFRHPVRHLLQKRLGLYLEEPDWVLEDREPFDIRGLDRYTLSQATMDALLRDESPESLLSLFQASGQLPPGNTGRAQWDRLYSEIRYFLDRTRPYLEGGEFRELPVDLTLGDFHIFGRIPYITQNHFIQLRYARITAGDHILFWIRHLLLNKIRTGPRTGFLVGLKKQQKGPDVWSAWEFPPVEGCGKAIRDLLSLYREGLQQPLPFFPRTSLEFAEKVVDKKISPENALSGVRKTWEGDEFSRGEMDDPYYQRCYRGRDPLNGAFQKVALRILEKPLRSRKEVL
jgi:exodeoxyribonuclease V gamma subunit